MERAKNVLLLSFLVTLTSSRRQEGFQVESFTLPPQIPARCLSWKYYLSPFSPVRIGWCDSTSASSCTQRSLSPQKDTYGSLPSREIGAKPSISTNTAPLASPNAAAAPTDSDTAVSEDSEIRTRRWNPDKFSATSMLNHGVLTKAEEQELGRALQRAMGVQKELLSHPSNVRSKPHPEEEEHSKKKNSRRGRPRGVKNKKKQEDRQEENGDTEDDLRRNLSIYGGRGGLDLEYLEAPHEEYRWQLQHMRRIRADTAAFDKLRNGKRDVLWNMDAAMATLDDMSNKAFKQVFGSTVEREEIENILTQGAMARDTLIRNNIRLVMEFAGRWIQNSQQKYLVSLEEAMQEGILGLAIAAERYDPERNLKFSTYATPWIINTIRRYFQRASVPYRLPVNYHDDKRRFQALVKSYHEAGMPVPTLPDLARELGMRLDRLCTILDRTRPAISMDAPAHNTAMTLAGKAGNTENTDGGLALGLNLVDPQQTSGEHDIDLSLLRQSLENAMASELVPHERDIVRLRLGLDDGVSRTVPQVIQAFYGSMNNSKNTRQLSPSQVRAAERQAYQKLRSPRSLSNYKLLAYLDFCGIDYHEEEQTTATTTTLHS